MKGDELKIVTYPNQKTVVAEHMPHDSLHTGYGCLNINAVCRAKRALNGNAFALYIRCVLNRQGFPYALSPSSFKADMGISENGYQSAVKELISKGYLVKRQDGRNAYTIYEMPPTLPPESADVPPETGVHHPQNGADIPPETGEETIHEQYNNIINNTTDGAEEDGLSIGEEYTPQDVPDMDIIETEPQVEEVREPVSNSTTHNPLERYSRVILDEDGKSCDVVQALYYTYPLHGVPSPSDDDMPF